MPLHDKRHGVGASVLCCAPLDVTIVMSAKYANPFVRSIIAKLLLLACVMVRQVTLVAVLFASGYTRYV
jgi:hypothetical protein